MLFFPDLNKLLPSHNSLGLCTHNNKSIYSHRSICANTHVYTQLFSLRIIEQEHLDRNFTTGKKKSSSYFSTCISLCLCVHAVCKVCQTSLWAHVSHCTTRWQEEMHIPHQKDGLCSQTCAHSLGESEPRAQQYRHKNTTSIKPPHYTGFQHKSLNCHVCNP